MLFPPAAGRTEVVDPFPEDGSPYPHFYALDTGKERYLAVFNWSEHTGIFQFPERFREKRYISLFTRQEKSASVILGARSAELLKELR